MATRLFLRQRVAPAALLAGFVLYPKTNVFAEAPDKINAKKPIYDDYELPPAPPTSTPTSPSDTTTKVRSPTPTDRLAAQIGKARVFLHGYIAAGENKVNEFMDQALHLESSFTSTIASLAPEPKTGEKLMPGSIYVLVAAMTGSIISRNRNIVLRAVVPAAVGIGAGWVVLPVTMRNVSDLLWKYEQRFPAVADAHLRTRQGFEKAWHMARVHSQQAVHIVDDKVSSSREAVEGWVRKGN
ncbi:mitochondrial protein-like protein [Bisporella sp. PMI_857]|nr:mitochondrial protein-like protein [Bisporella sp. PMI_857]